MKWKFKLKKAVEVQNFKELVGRAKTQSANYLKLSELITDLAYDIDEQDIPEDVYSEIRELWHNINIIDDNMDIHLEKIQSILRGV